MYHSIMYNLEINDISLGNDLFASESEKEIDIRESSAIFWPCIAIAIVHIFDALCYMTQGMC